MKKVLLISSLAAIMLSNCSTTKVVRQAAYEGFYKQKPVAILLMPPINRSTEVEAKEYFHSTLNIPIADAGYYVIPPFLSMEILKKESAYESELFLSSPLDKFGEVFGADLALFTIINRWDKTGVSVIVEVEYIFKSIKTNEVIYARKGTITYSTVVQTGIGGVAGLIANVAASAINNVTTKYVDIAKVCNSYTFKDLPAGKYSPRFELDGNEFVGEKEFKVDLDSKY